MCILLQAFQIIIKICFFSFRGGFPLYPKIFTSYTVTLPVLRVLSAVRDAGFEPGTTASAAFQLLKLNIVIRIIAIPRISRGEKNDKLKIYSR